MLDISPTDRVFLLTGAGVSAESGIPTFRGVTWLWRNYRIEEVASPHAWARDPRLVWEFYSMRRRVAGAAKPNPAHAALAKLEQQLGDRLFLCTQNATCTSRLGRGMSSTCTGNSSRADVIHATARLSMTPISTSRKPNSRAAHAEAESDRTFAGSVRRRSNWTGFSVPATNARSSWLLVHQVWLSPQRVS
jgi:hypothetical protein